MGPARRIWLRVGFALVLAAAAGPALSQTDLPHHRPKPVVAPPAANTLDDNVPGDVVNANPPASGLGAPKVQVRRPLIPDLVLRSAIHSRYSQTPVITATTSGQCRARCAEGRTQCDGGQGDSGLGGLGECDPAWTRCLSTCDGLTYSRGP